MTLLPSTALPDREAQGDYRRHCERSEAIQSHIAALDCFAALAMTGGLRAAPKLAAIDLAGEEVWTRLLSPRAAGLSGE